MHGLFGLLLGGLAGVVGALIVAGPTDGHTGNDLHADGPGDAAGAQAVPGDADRADAGNRPATVHADAATTDAEPGAGESTADEPVVRPVFGLDAAWRRDLPLGKGTITGVVRTADGEPVAGAEVMLFRAHAPGERWASRPNLDRFYDRPVILPRRPASDAQGRFTAHGVPEDALVTVSVRVRHMRVVPADKPDERTSAPVRAGAHLEFVAHPLATVTFDLRTPDGPLSGPAYVSQPLQRIQRRAGTATARATHPWLRGDAPLQFEPGDYALTFESDDGRFVAEETYTFGPGPRTVVVDLQPRPGIRVLIDLSESGYHPMSVSAMVRELPVGEPVPTDAAELERLLQPGGGAIEAPRYGEYTAPVFGGLPAGRYLVGVMLQRRQLKATAIVDVKDRMVDVPIVVPLPPRHLVVEFELLDPAGLPISDGDIRATCPNFTSFGDARPVGNGRWRLELAPVVARMEPGSMVDLIVESPVHGQVTTEFEVTDAPTARVRFVATGRLTLRLAGLAALVAGDRDHIELSMMAYDPDEWGGRRGGSNFSGATSRAAAPTLVFDAVAVGLHMIGVRYNPRPQIPYGTRAIMTLAIVSIRQGENEATIELPRIVPVTFQIAADGPGFAAISVYRRFDDHPDTRIAGQDLLMYQDVPRHLSSDKPAPTVRMPVGSYLHEQVIVPADPDGEPQRVVTPFTIGPGATTVTIHPPE
jgi:hypothetical protein